MSTKLSDRALLGLALLGAQLALFGEVHPACDQWLQTSEDALGKGMSGRHLVYHDGATVDNDDTDAHRRGEPTRTADAHSAICTARHVARYTAGQVVATVVATRVVGYRVPFRALAAGVLINAATHYVIDVQRFGLRLASRFARQDGYREHVTVVRKPGGDADPYGPGTASFELDQSLHRLIGVAAAAVSTWLAVRCDRS